MLKAPHIEAQPIADSPLKDGCGWLNARAHVDGGRREGRLRQGHLRGRRGARHLAASTTCSRWRRRCSASASPSIQSFGSYSCRNIIGNSKWKAWRSEHATANAVDIGAFQLADGRRISVAQHWKGDGVEARFLRAVHGRACRYFRVAIGPDYNEAHRDHFHFDRGMLSRCK